VKFGGPTLPPFFPMSVRLWKILGLGLGLLAGSLSAQSASEPQLSADDPITADFNTQELVARGNARFEHEEIVVEAEEIRFNQTTRVLTATGQVRVTRRGLRIVSERVTYQVDTREFSSGRFRAGSPPLFVEGESFSGNLDEFTLENARFHYLEPDAASPTLIVREARVQPGERVAGKGVRLRLPFLGGIPLPDFERDLDAPTLDIQGQGGYRNRLGVFVQTRVQFPLDEDLRVGANLDLYSRRGVLLGPTLRYRRDLGEDNFTRLSFSSGWIADQGGTTRGVDVLGEKVPFHRYLGDLQLHHRADRLEVVLSTSILSDSEVERDFREERFNAAPHPDSFFELTRIFGRDLFFSVFLERNPNDFFRNLERVPEVTLELPLQPLGERGTLHGFKARYLRLRAWGHDPAVATATDPDALAELRLDRNNLWPEASLLRFDAPEGWADLAELTYSLRHPLALHPGVTLTPLFEASLHASRREENGDTVLAAFAEGEGALLAYGFDLEAHLHASFALDNRVWNIRQLRHVIEPVAQFRFFDRQGEGAQGGALPGFTVTRPELDLLMRRDRLFDFDRQLLLRTGVRNVFLAEGFDGAVRELGTLGLYHDAVKHSGDTLPDRSRLYLELSLRPARWLEFRLDQRLGLKAGDQDEARLRAILRSAEAWELELAADYFEGLYHQYRVEGVYRVSERAALFGGWRLDARRSELTRQIYGLRYTLGQAWEIEAALVFRQGARREDDIGFTAGVRLLEF
jgi:LPS-assembly protein